MKHIQRLIAIFVLTMALAFSAVAGHIPGPGVQEPPPPPTTVTAEMTTGVTGNMSTGITATDSTTDIFLNLLQSLLSLF